MNPRYPFVASRAAHRCEYCHAPEQVFNFPFEVEHIIPLYRDGADAESNWALSCRSCNLRKGTRVEGRDPESEVEIRLFHPRRDKWDEHFQVDVESGTIAGTTAMGSHGTYLNLVSPHRTRLFVGADRSTKKG